jgi:hypothetical protein
MIAIMDLITPKRVELTAYFCQHAEQPQLFKQCTSVMLMFLNAVSILIASFFLNLH